VQPTPDRIRVEEILELKSQTHTYTSAFPHQLTNFVLLHERILHCRLQQRADNKIEEGRAWDLKKADQDIPRNQRKLEEKATRKIY